MHSDSIMPFPSALASKTCKLAIELFERSHEKYPGETGFGLTEERKSSVDLDIDDSIEVWRPIHEHLQTSLQELIESFVEKNPGMGSYSGLVCTGFRVHKYPKGGGHFDWHIDSFDSSVAKRLLSVVWYLNSVSEGGATDFKNQEISIKATEGSAVVFPSNFEYIHRSSPNLSEDKYVIVTFVEMENSRASVPECVGKASKYDDDHGLSPTNVATVELALPSWRAEWQAYTLKLSEFVAGLVEVDLSIRNSALSRHLEHVASGRAKLDPRVHFFAWHGQSLEAEDIANLVNNDPVRRGERPKIYSKTEEIWSLVEGEIMSGGGLNAISTISSEPSFTERRTDAERVNQALDLIELAWPEGYLQIVDCIHSIDIIERPALRSSIARSAFGAIFLSLKSEYSTLEIADLITHETAHTALSIKQGFLDFVTNPDDMCLSPFRDSMRPIDGVLHSVFVLSRVINLRRRCKKHEISGDLERSLPDIARYEKMLLDGIKSLLDVAELTPSGHALLESILLASQSDYTVNKD